MLLNTALFLSATVLSRVLGATGPPPPPVGVPQTDFDVIIVGGGPSGLSALSALARVRRHAYLIDSGMYRNGPTRHMHDVLGFDGVTPSYYRWAARQQISQYDTVSMSNGTVTRIEPASDHAPYFTVHVDTPSSPTPASLTARKVILGTGLRDLLPDTPGVRENWGRGIYWCPWCDGHEHADQPLGLLGPLDDVAGMVREILTLNTDLYALVNGTDTPGVRAAAETAFPQWREYLQIQNVTVDNRTITRVERLRDGVSGAEDPSLATVTEHDLFRVDFAEGPSVERAAFFVSFKDEQRSLVGPDLGVQMYAGRMAGNQSQGFQTNVEGVYAIGDANADNSTNVPHALYTGKRAAVFIQVQLERENGVVELAAADAQMQRRSIHEEARSLWERMNGEAGDILYAGDFEQ